MPDCAPKVVFRRWASCADAMTLLIYFTVGLSNHGHCMQCGIGLPDPRASVSRLHARHF